MSALPRDALTLPSVLSKQLAPKLVAGECQANPVTNSFADFGFGFRFFVMDKAT